MAKYKTVRGKLQSKPGQDPITKGIQKGVQAVKNTVSGAGQELAYLGSKVKTALKTPPQKNKVKNFPRGGSRTGPKYGAMGQY